MISDPYYKVLYLLAACLKYEMTSVQSSIRAEVERGKFPVPKGTEAFSAYAIASAKGLIPEMEKAARMTLDYPMTFEILGEGLRLFEGSTLFDLARFRRRCRDTFVTRIDTFLTRRFSARSYPGCEDEFLSAILNDLKRQKFTSPLDLHSRIRREYLMASNWKYHGTCDFCLAWHPRNGSICAELEYTLAQARNK
jgi:hypothetical protein